MHRVLIALAAIALILAACGGSDDKTSATPTPSASPARTPLATNGGIVPPSPTTTDQVIYPTAAIVDERVVALLDSAFRAADGKLFGAVVLHNRNRSEAVIVQYKVTPVYNGADGPTATYAVVILPDEQITDAFEATYPVDSQLTTTKISVLPSERWLPFSAAERLTTASVLSGRAEGTITNPFDYETGPLRVSVVARDEGGGVIESHAVTVDSIPSHGAGNFSVPFDPSVTLFQVFVSFADDFPPWMTAP